MAPLAVMSTLRPGWLWAAGAVWLTTAVVGAAVMRWRGHDGFCWTVVFSAFGPLALPLAVSAERRRLVDPPVADHPGTLDVLVAVDPTAEPEADAAAERLVTVPGGRVSSVTSPPSSSTKRRTRSGAAKKRTPPGGGWRQSPPASGRR